MKKVGETETVQSDQKEETYRTNSLPLSSYLCSCKEIVFAGTNKEQSPIPHVPPTVFFLFKPLDKAKIFADKYFIGDASVNPMDLFKNYRALKDLVFETKRNPDA